MTPTDKQPADDSFFIADDEIPCIDFPCIDDKAHDFRGKYFCARCGMDWAGLTPESKAAASDRLDRACRRERRWSIAQWVIGGSVGLALAMANVPVAAVLAIVGVLWVLCRTKNE